jgi:cell division septation protein DedD
MAVTVVLVVTFLTGVLVGRGVRAERAEAAQAEVLTDTPPTPDRTPDAGAISDDPRQATPPPQSDEATPEPPQAAPRTPEPVAKSTPEPAPASAASAPAANSSTTPTPAATPQKSPAPAAAKPPAPAAAKSPAAVAANTTTSNPPATAKTTAAATPDAATAVPSAPPSGPRNGYTVQVAAVNARGEAETIVRRLSAKGYSAYVEVPKNTPSVFRVRVGTFRTRREAQNMAERLRKEEKFKPWVTR